MRKTKTTRPHHVATLHPQSPILAPVNPNPATICPNPPKPAISRHAFIFSQNEPTAPAAPLSPCNPISKLNPPAQNKPTVPHPAPQRTTRRNIAPQVPAHFRKTNPPPLRAHCQTNPPAMQNKPTVPRPAPQRTTRRNTAPQVPPHFRKTNP